MSETTAEEADAIRRRCAVVFGVAPESLLDDPVENLRRVLEVYDAQRELYLSMGFEVDDPEALEADAAPAA